MNSRQHILTLMLCVISLSGFAQQIDVQLDINPEISPYLYEWEGANSGDILVTTINPSPDFVPTIYRVWMVNGGGVEIANSSISATPISEVPPGASTVPLAELFPLSALEYNGDFALEISQTGKLPEDNYMLCIEALQPGNLQPISQQSCGNFTVQGYQDPFNIYPPDGEQIDGEMVQDLVFQWSPVAPSPSFEERYVISVYQIFPNQDPTEAVSVNPSILDEEVIGETQFIVPIDYVAFEPNEEGYVWTVTPISPEGTPYTSPNGQSQPTVFGVTSSTSDECTCVSCELLDVKMFINGVESNSSSIPVGTAVSFEPVYNVVCNDADCEVQITGQVIASYSSQTAPNETHNLEIGETVVLPANGVLYITWNGSASCDGSICECTGTYGPVQIQVTGGDTDTLPEDDEGITDIEETEEEGADCECGPCSLSSLAFMRNGSPITSKSLPLDVPISISATINASCNPTSCPSIINGYFKVGYTPPGGSWTQHVLLDENSTFSIPQGVTMLIIDFIGTVICEGQECPCDGMNGLEIFVGSPENGDGIPDPENPGDDPPDKVPPPPESIPKECNATAISNTPATPIDLGMVLDKPIESPYPRAVPLRAEGIDWDYAIFECSGCEDGQSEFKYPVKDRMNLTAYKWRILEGMGSLNKAFSASDITDEKDKKKALEEKLKELEAKKIELQERLKSGISQDSLKYSATLDDAKNAYDNLTSEVAAMSDSLEFTEEQLKLVDERFDEHSDTLETYQDTLSAVINRIDDLKFKLTNPPSEAETTALAEAEEKVEEWNEARQAVIDFEEELIQSVKEINNNLNSLKDAERDQAEAYRVKQNEIFAKARLKADLEAALYGTPELKKYRRTRVKWTNAFNTFFGSFTANESIGSTAQTKKVTINDGSKTIAMTILEDRGTLYDELHLEFLGFSALPAMACSAEDDSQNCSEYASELVLATLNYDSAMAELSASSSYLDPAIMAQIEDARSALISLESGLISARSSVEQASQAYSQAVQASVGQLAALEMSKQERINTMNQKAEVAGVAEQNYQEKKKERELLFDQNRLSFELDLNAEISSKAFTVDDIKTREDSLSAIFMIQNELRDIIEELNFQMDAIKEQIENYKIVIDYLESQKAALKNEPAEIALAVKKIDADIKGLKAKIKESAKKLAKLKQPSKTAQGALVYYIPPPLEVIFEAQGKLPTFEEYISKVDSAKIALDLALINKESLQQKLVQSIDNMAWNLLSYKNNSASIEELESQIKDVSHQIGAVKNKVAKEALTDNLKNIQTAYDEARANQKEAEKNAEECEVEESAEQEKVNDLESEKQNAEANVAEKKEALATAKSGLKYQEGLFRNSSNTLRERSNSVSEKKGKIKEIEQAIGRIQNEETIEKAKSEDAEGDTPAELQELQNQLETEQTNLENLLTQLNSTESSQGANATALKTATKQMYEADSLLVIANKELQALKDSLTSAYDQLKEGNNCSNSWTIQAKEWKRKADKLKLALDQKSKDVKQSVNEDEAVQELTATHAELKEQVEDLKASLPKLKTDFAEPISNKEKWESEADSMITKAREDLAKAQEKLRQWLVSEFETVKFDVKIELRGDDEVADKWRSGDDEAKLIKTLRYNGSRVPKFDNKYAKGGLGESTINAVCQIEVEKKIGAAPKKLSPPSPHGPEPRTIALVYEDGEPIWKEWPVIPQDETRFLQFDLLFLRTAFIADLDIFKYFCTTNAQCKIPLPIESSVVDVGKYRWELEGTHINEPKDWRYAIWKTAAVNKPLEYKDQKLKSFHNASLIKGDAEIEQESKFRVYPGVLIEVPDTIFGVPDTTVELLGRIVAGNHKGLNAEDVEFSIRKIAGSSKGYKIVGADTLKVEQTDGLGYAKVDFNFGDGYASYEALVKWLRGGKVIQTDKIFLIAPIKISIHKSGAGPPELAWQTAVNSLMNKNKDIENISESLPNCSYDNEEDITDECQRQLRAVAGLTNYHSNFVNDFIVEFEANKSSKVKVNPSRDSTEYFGIAHTLIQNAKEDVEITLTASVEEKYLPVGMPGTDTDKVSNGMIDKFYIGTEEAPFLVLLDNPVPEGSGINGEGMLGVDLTGGGIGLMMPLQQVKFKIEDVVVENISNNYIAKAGSVVWEGDGVVKVKVLSFTLEARKLGITASLGAIVEGVVGHDKVLPNPIGFSGNFEPTGNFVAGISNLPELEFKGIKLKEGASIQLDMHSNAGPTDKLGFRGVFIPNASLELPIQFSNSETKTPTVISAENFYIGTSGIGGKVSLTGAFFEIGYHDYKVSGRSVSITLKDNELEEFSIGGNLQLGSPFQGDIGLEITHSGEKFQALISTETPVLIPQVKAVVSILHNSGFTAENDIYILSLNANVSSEKIGDIKVDNFKISTDSGVSVDEVALNGEINFGSGFQIQNPKFSFNISNKETSFWLAGKVILPKLEDTYLDGVVGMKPGAVFYVEIKEAAITIDYGPVTMKGKLAFSEAEFRGEFGVGFKNMSKGIDGLLIFGNKPNASGDVAYSYWYAELSVGVAIPIAQTGVSILKLGGGLGFNYTPPMGNTEGFAVNTNSLSFKALMGFGNTPMGKIVAGDVELSFTSTAFSLYGRVWALNKRESFFGEGQITLIYNPAPVKLEGFVGMGLKMPDPEGLITDFDGKVNFKFAPGVFDIESEKISGSVFKEVQSEGNIKVNNTKMHMDGKVWYDLNTSFDFTDSERIEVVLNVEAAGDFDYIIETKTISTTLNFDGNWRVTFVNRIYDVNITSGAIALNAAATASPSAISLEASADISWDFLFASGSMNANFGYTATL